MQSLSFKISYGEEIRRATFNVSSFEQLFVQCANVFGFASCEGLALTYKDVDNDEITMASDNDLNEAMKHVDSKGLLKLTLSRRNVNTGTAPNLYNRVGIEELQQMRDFTGPTRDPNNNNFFPRPHGLCKVSMHEARAALIKSGITEEQLNGMTRWDIIAMLRKMQWEGHMQKKMLCVAKCKKEHKKSMKKEHKCLKKEHKCLKRDYKCMKKWEKKSHKRVSLVEDTTIPKFTLLPPGSPYVKTWKIRNIGEEAWPVGSKLVLKSKCGAGKGATSVNVPTEIPLPVEVPIQAQQEVNVSLNLVAPTELGKRVYRYKIVTPDGKKLGRATISLFVGTEEQRTEWQAKRMEKKCKRGHWRMFEGMDERREWMARNGMQHPHHGGWMRHPGFGPMHGPMQHGGWMRHHGFGPMHGPMHGPMQHGGWMGFHPGFSPMHGEMQKKVDEIMEMGVNVPRKKVFRILLKCDGDVQKVVEVLDKCKLV